MLQDIRDNSQGWIAKTVIGVIVLLLSLTGFEAIFRAVSSNDTAAKVNGESISRAEVAMTADYQRRVLLSQQNVDPARLEEKTLRETALQELIDRHLLLRGARDAGFAISEGIVDQILLQVPAFLNEKGEFSPELFDRVIQNQGYGRLQYRELVKSETLINMMQNSVAGSAFVSNTELETLDRLARETRSFSYMLLKADAQTIKVSDADIKGWYEGHASEYSIPEQITLQYVAMTSASLVDKMAVSDAEIRDRYDQEIANLVEQRRIAHIQVSVDKGQSEDEARAKVDDLVKRLGKGEDFGKIAKTFSQDLGSSRQGGDLGLVAINSTDFDPDFMKVVNSLKKGEVSKPVRTVDGWHLIKVLDVKVPVIPSLESEKTRLTLVLKQEKADSEFLEHVRDLGNSAYEAADLEQPAKEFGLKVQEIVGVTRDGGSGIATNPKVVQAAFDEEVLDTGANSAVVELDPNTVVVVRVKEHQQAKPMTLEQAQGKIREQLAHDRALDKAKAEGHGLITQLSTAKSGELESRQKWTVVADASRQQPAVDGKILREVFRIPEGNAEKRFAGVELDNGDYAVIRLDGVHGPSQGLSAEQKAGFRRVVETIRGLADYQSYHAQLKTDAVIEKVADDE